MNQLNTSDVEMVDSTKPNLPPPLFTQTPSPVPLEDTPRVNNSNHSSNASSPVCLSSDPDQLNASLSNYLNPSFSNQMNWSFSSHLNVYAPRVSPDFPENALPVNYSSNASSPACVQGEYNQLHTSFNTSFPCQSPISASSVFGGDFKPTPQSLPKKAKSKPLSKPNSQPQSARVLFRPAEEFTQDHEFSLPRLCELSAREQNGLLYCQSLNTHDALTTEMKFSRGHRYSECSQQLFVDEHYLWCSRSAARISHLRSPFAKYADGSQALIMHRARCAYGQQTQRSDFTFMYCQKAVRPALMDASEVKNFTGWTLSHELCNLNRSLHTLTVDVAVILAIAEQKRLKKRTLPHTPQFADMHSQDVRLNLNFQMVYEPGAFRFSHFALCSSASMLNSKCNTFLREPSSTVYILLQPTLCSAEFTAMMKQYLQNTQTFNVSLAMGSDGGDMPGHRDYSYNVELSTTTDKSVFRRVCDLACQLYIVFAKRLNAKGYLPHFVLVGCKENLGLCFVFFQMWQRLQMVSQLRHSMHEIGLYCTHHDMDRDWHLLLAKSHFFARLARPDMSFEKFNAFTVPPEEQFVDYAVESLEDFSKKEAETKQTLDCVKSWISRSSTPNCRLSPDFCLTEDLFGDDLMPNGMTSCHQFNEEIYKTAIARYCPPVVLDSTIGNGARQLQLYYLMMNAKEPYPFGTFDVEAAAAMSRFLNMYPRMARMNSDDESDERARQTGLYAQWFYSALEPFNLSVDYKDYPMGQLFGLRRPECNFHDSLTAICESRSVASSGISFFPVRWDLSLPHFTNKYGPVYKGRCTVIQHVAAAVREAYICSTVHVPFRDVNWTEGNKYNTYITHNAQAHAMPYCQDQGLVKLIEVASKQAHNQDAPLPAEF